MTLVQFIIINIGALVTASGGVFLKRLSEQLSHEIALNEILFHAIKNPNLWIGGFCFVSPIFLWTYLLKYMELTKLQPMLSVVYIYTVALSIVFLGEYPSAMRLFGLALIVVGVVIVGRS